MALLSVQALSKSFGDFKAVTDLSFEIQAGECVGLLGPNGAGKSTSINCITGFYPTSSGTVTIDGYDVHAKPKLARRFLGVCPQEDTLDTDFDVLDQLIRHATFYKISVPEAKRRAQELLKIFDLSDKAYQPVEHLSGGMRRKLQVARAMISAPKVLVLDEPTTGLDPDARRSLWNILTENRKHGIATLLCTHYMDEAEQLCDRIILLYQGKILDFDTPKNLIEKHVGTEIIEDEVRPGVVWRRPPNLEDLFIKLTGKHLGGSA